MRISVTLKSPDSLYNTSREYAQQCLDNESSDVLSSYDKNEKYYLEDKCNEFMELCETWFKYGEFLTVEVDTDKKEIGVV